MIETDRTISTILKHDRKTNSYKIALVRSINDVVLAFPDVRSLGRDVAVPLRLLAHYWLAYYWPFVDKVNPVWQGQRAHDPRDGRLRNDIAFRPELTDLRQQWQKIIGQGARAADGFFLINERRVARRWQSYPAAFRAAYEKAVVAIVKAIHMPICYAGPGQWAVFARPVPYKQMPASMVAVPGTQPNERCVVVTADLWAAFRRLSLWAEALCIHEWCLLSERFQPDVVLDDYRGIVYGLLTDRPDNRRPLTWERNQIDLMLLEGTVFTCPWTEKPIRAGMGYDLDHLVPLAIYPTNELWNLLPSDPAFNKRVKRDRLPSASRLLQAQPHLTAAYGLYEQQATLGPVLREDVAARFVTVDPDSQNFPAGVAQAVVGLIEQVIDARHWQQF